MSALPAHEPAKHPSSSFAKSLFRGEIHTDMVLPFPGMEQAERKRVSDLISSLRDVVDDLYDPVKASENGWVGDDLIAGLGERGLLGLYVGEQYGGQGLSQTGYCRVMEEYGAVDASLSVAMGVHQSIGMKPLHLFGSDEQKERFLPDLASGRKLAAFALTEPDAGSDAHNIQSRAERREAVHRKRIERCARDIRTKRPRIRRSHPRERHGWPRGWPALRHPRSARQRLAAFTFQRCTGPFGESVRGAGRRVSDRDAYLEQRQD